MVLAQRSIVRAGVFCATLNQCGLSPGTWPAGPAGREHRPCRGRPRRSTPRGRTSSPPGGHARQRGAVAPEAAGTRALAHREHRGTAARWPPIRQPARRALAADARAATARHRLPGKAPLGAPRGARGTRRAARLSRANRRGLRLGEGARARSAARSPDGSVRGAAHRRGDFNAPQAEPLTGRS
jgi:hypothetical protein